MLSLYVPKYLFLYSYCFLILTMLRIKNLYNVINRNEVDNDLE